MLNRHEARQFNEQEWACMSVQAPLGTVLLARRLPPPPAPARAGGTIVISRRSAPSNPPGSATKRLRLRRSL